MEYSLGTLRFRLCRLCPILMSMTGLLPDDRKMRLDILSLMSNQSVMTKCYRLWVHEVSRMKQLSNSFQQ